MSVSVTAGRDLTADETWQWLVTSLKGRPVPPFLILIGFGDGILLDALQRHAPATRVLALEPEPWRGPAVLARSSVQAWRDTGRLVYLVGPEYAGADTAWRSVPTKTDAPHTALVHPALTLTPDARQAAEVLKKILGGAAANQEARRKFAPRYLTNSIRNLPAIAAGSDVRALADAYRGVPAVIAAAGPSLDAVIPELRAAQGRALLIACDTALRPLLVHGLAPHLAVAVDPSAINARHMLSLPECSGTWLVSESALDPQAAAVFPGRTFWYRVSQHEPWPWLNTLGIDIGQVDVWGSVLTAAFQVAHLAGCDPIVMVGADLSYTGGRPYARGTTFEFDWARAAAMGQTLDETWRKQVAAAEPIPAQDLHGRETMTTSVLVQFRDWLVARARQSGRNVINATGAGILAGPGVTQGTLAAALLHGVDVPPIAARAEKLAGIRPSSLARHLCDTRELLNAPGSAAPLVARWREFSGGGFDRENVAAALNEAADALETGQETSGAATGKPCAPLTEAGSSTTVLPTLPEALSRHRAMLTGAEALPQQTDGRPLAHEERTALLVDALALLARIQAELSRIDDLPATAWPWAMGKLPVSALYEWPESVGWSVVLFEGLLGLAGVSDPGVADRTFFTGPVRPRGADEDRDARPAVADRSNSTQACLLLACEWLEYWRNLEPDRDTRASLTRLSGIASAVRGAADVALATPPAILSLRARAGGLAVSCELPLRADGSAFGRMLTGVMCSAAGEPETHVEILSADTTALTVSVRIPASPRPPSGPARVIEPRPFPDERVARALISYVTAHGVVCVPTNATRSFLVSEDGSVEMHHEWPQPIVAELPLGTDGALAWATGRACSPVVAPYVMYRRAAAAEAIVESLPFAPSWGAWWEDRVYWTYLPSDVQPGRGLGSWAPGADARIESTADLAAFSVHAEESGLAIEPATRRVPDNVHQRRLLQHGWTWHPARGLEPRSLGPYGAAASYAHYDGWTATAYPEKDCVTLERSGDPGTTLLLRVYYPVRLAWLGPSLLVNTIDHQLLIFDDLLAGM